MRRKIFPALTFLISALTLLYCEQISAQNQQECFEYSGTALFAGLWFGDGQTSFDRTRTIDGDRYHQAKIWATGEYRLELIEAFEFGIPGIRFFPDENSAQNQPKNMYFWVQSEGPFGNFDPDNSRNSSEVQAAPAQFVNTKSEILSWMMGLIYGEGWRTGTLLDDSKAVGIDRIRAAKALIEQANFETVAIQEQSNKYRLYITSAEFDKLLALPFQKWTRVPGNNGSSEAPRNVVPYPSCDDEEMDGGMDARYDASLGNAPGTNIKLDVLKNDILSDGSVATFDKIQFDLNPDSSSLNTWAGTDTYAWRINLSGQLVFKPKSGFDGQIKTLKYKIIEKATGLSDVVYAKVGYDLNQVTNGSAVFLHFDPLSQGKQLQIRLPEDSATTDCNVFDLSGRLLHQFTVSGENGSFETETLNKGIYILKVYLAGETETKRFVVD